MYLSVVSNIINVIGNLIGVFVLRAGVAGVAYPSLIARTFSAVMITVLCFQRKNEVFYRCKWIFRWNVDFMKQILKIAIPNGMENGVFQLVKVALSGIVALLEHIRLLQMVLHKVSGRWLRWRESLWVPYL